MFKDLYSYTTTWGPSNLTTWPNIDKKVPGLVWEDLLDVIMIINSAIPVLDGTLQGMRRKHLALGAIDVTVNLISKDYIQENKNLT